jgi:hypothetical protein
MLEFELLDEEDCSECFVKDIKDGASDLKSQVKQDSNLSDDCSDDFEKDVKKGAADLKSKVNSKSVDTKSTIAKTESFLASVGMKSTV